jgi:putative membrane-bound dehydrogenase-like protein
MNTFFKKSSSLLLVFVFCCAAMGVYQSTFVSDGPPALSPQESLKAFQISPEFKVELVASEPLLHEPTSVCWDASGQLYVSELHGYNLEGLLEIEDLNKTGKIDTIVRRIEAEAKYKKAAEAGTYGTVKRLIDTDKDGQMDKAMVFADRISPAYGLCAAREGLIVAGQTCVIYLADIDKDGKAEVIDTLFSGFQGGLLERGINAPQWGADGWIYFGRGWNGGLITGPKLKKAVELPGANFRIRADGSAIEPVTGSTHTIGHAFTADGDSFFSNTWKHALYAAPIPWQYLIRNPDASISDLEGDASDYATVFPTAAVHPWKMARSNQKEWNTLYAKYGLAESAAGGYFTSSCSPMIYQDILFPKEYLGNLFVCEPGQSLVHRCIISKEGTGLKV